MALRQVERVQGEPNAAQGLSQLCPRAETMASALLRVLPPTFSPRRPGPALLVCSCRSQRKSLIGSAQGAAYSRNPQLWPRERGELAQKTVTCVERGGEREVGTVPGTVLKTNPLGLEFVSSSCAPANRNRLLEPWGVKQTLEVKMDINGGHCLGN